VYAAVASVGGSPQNPRWYANLVAHPTVELRDRDTIKTVTAREVFGDEKSLWWARAVEAYPTYAEYQTRTSREIPVFVLE
jgi:deazaflavin-dependent oxidoreductase (nitroreductase family)